MRLKFLADPLEWVVAKRAHFKPCFRRKWYLRTKNFLIGREAFTLKGNLKILEKQIFLQRRVSSLSFLTISRKIKYN